MPVEDLPGRSGTRWARCNCSVKIREYIICPRGCQRTPLSVEVGPEGGEAHREIPIVKLLCLDTSGSAGSIVLSEDCTILGEINLDSACTHTARLLSGIQYLLSHAEVTLNDIQAFGVVCGPGSFTGIRIGLTTVKGLAETLGKPTVAVTAFEAWVERFPEWQGVLVPMIDARRGEVYAAVFERRQSRLIQRDSGLVGAPGELLDTLDEETVLFLGGGAQKYRDLIRSRGRPRWRVAQTDPFLGRSLATLASSKAERGEWTAPPDLRAFYLRRSDAEVKWKGP